MTFYELKIYFNNNKMENDLCCHVEIYNFAMYDMKVDLCNTYDPMIRQLLSKEGFIMEYFNDNVEIDFHKYDFNLDILYDLHIEKIIIDDDYLFIRLQKFKEYLKKHFQFHVEIKTIKGIS